MPIGPRAVDGRLDVIALLLPSSIELCLRAVRTRSADLQSGPRIQGLLKSFLPSCQLPSSCFHALPLPSVLPTSPSLSRDTRRSKSFPFITAERHPNSVICASSRDLVSPALVSLLLLSFLFTSSHRPCLLPSPTSSSLGSPPSQLHSCLRTPQLASRGASPQRSVLLKP